MIPPRWANVGVGEPTDIDDERCILFCTRLTVNMTGDLSVIEQKIKTNKLTNDSIEIQTN